MPPLDPWASLTLELFLQVQSQWEYDSFNGVRLGIPRDRVTDEATALGIGDFWNQPITRLIFRVFESEIIKQDNEAATIRANTQQH